MGLDIRNKFDYSERAVLGVATKNSSTNLDLKITGDNEYVQGGHLLYQNANWGDYIIAQVVDKDNVLGYGSNTVLNEYIHKRYVHPALNTSKLEVPYAGMVPVNTYLRVIYISTGTTVDVDVAVNYTMHDGLV